MPEAFLGMRRAFLGRLEAFVAGKSAESLGRGR
jgi:hypothetical protein